MNLPKQVTIVEVGPRDGLQNESEFVPTAQKINLINQLAETWLSRIEVTSFVHPKWVPQLSDATEVVSAIKRKNGISYSAPVPNVKGLERALESGIDEIAVFVSASETHNKRNVNMSVSESLKALRQVVRMALDNGIRVRGYIVTAFGCPYEGCVPLKRVEEITQEYLSMGVSEIALGDTTGMANPLQVSWTIRQLKDNLNNIDLALHFHNTRGAGLANVLAALLEGITIFDGSIGGLGGCPYAPGATGNIPTEDMVHMLENMGVSTGIDLPKLISCAKTAQEYLGRELPGQVMKAEPVFWANTGTFSQKRQS